MKLPARIRGVGLGLSVLAAAPLVAAALTTATPGRVAENSVPRDLARLAGAQRTVREVPFRPAAILRLHAPFPPPPAVAPPKPKPVRKAAAAVPARTWPHTAVVADILAAAAKWGVDGNWMLRIASCESGLRPNAYNSSGPYYGLFQFLMSTFTHNGGHNIWDPADQADIAAKMLAHGQAHQWSCA